MALNSRILAAKSQFFGVMGMSNADKELVVKVRSTCSHLPLEIPSYERGMARVLGYDRRN
jgi:hypothetical protein